MILICFRSLPANCVNQQKMENKKFQSYNKINSTETKDNTNNFKCNSLFVRVKHHGNTTETSSIDTRKKN